METETAHDSEPGEEGGDRCSHKDPHAVLTGSVLGSSIWLSSGSHFMFVSVSGYIYGYLGRLQELEGFLWGNYALLHFPENSSANMFSYYGI